MKSLFNAFSVKFLCTMLWLVAASAGSVYTAMKGSYAWMAACILLCLIAIIRLWRIYGRNSRKIAFTFDSMDNDDFSFRFDTGNVSRGDKMVNESLNRIRTLMRRVTDEAREREKFYETTINAVEAGIIVIDKGGNVLQKNTSFLKLTGFSILTHINQLRNMDSEMESVLGSILPGERQQVTIHDETGSRTLSVRATSAFMKNNPVKIIALNDIGSELNENEIDSWIKLIRVLTHEIMNSLTPIVSLSSTLGEKVKPGSQIGEGLDVIHKTGTELVSFIESYRKFTHIPAPEPSLLYVKDIAERMKAIAMQQPGADTIRFSVNVEPADLIVFADEKLAAHVLTNLLKNAVQAITEAGQGDSITISARNNADDHVEIDVSDNGPVIPEDIAAHIFVPFFSTRKSGTGIGLSISRQIMRLSGGSIRLLTDREHSLTIFRLTFS